MTRELDIAAIGPGRSHLVEANAGTGKTYAIANLFLRFILDDFKASEILVVTFTDAATEELRQRIRARLDQALTYLQADGEDRTDDPWFDRLRQRFPEGEPRERACLRLELALYSINEAPIHTIHGFCQHTLSELAFRSGQPFGQEQADDGALREQALLDWWRKRTYGANEEELARFLELTNGLEEFRVRLEPLLRPNRPEPVPEPLGPDGLNALEKQIRETQARLTSLWQEQGKEATERLLTSNKLSRTKDNGQKPEILGPVLEAIGEHLRERPEEPLPMPWLERIATSRIEIKPSQQPCSAFEVEPFRTADRLLELRHQQISQERLALLIDACAFVQEKTALAKHRLGQLSFDDMITRLHRALTAKDAMAKDLAGELARRLPVIMVDEFQDTDPLQYGIFRAIHHHGGEEHTLILIGDPKQAIYAFRGGDIFAYLQAANEADERWSLSVNWRSSREMIDAVNRLFSGDAPFVFPEISYLPSQPPPDESSTPALTGDSVPPAPLIVHRLPAEIEVGGKMKKPNKGEALERVHASVARRIHWLLREADLRFGDQPLQEGDICVLVRSWHEADALRGTLREYGIRAVSAGKSNLWDSEEARGLRQLLEAALLPDDRHLARQALTAPFLNLGPERLLSIIEESRHWGRWVALLHQVHEQWQRRGFMSAFLTLLQGLEEALGESWLSRTTLPERCLTNLLHLAELLQQASRERGDADALLAWMQEQSGRGSGEEELLRLESDENLVRITTMHSSKGLQYPVVMVPYLWYCREQDIRSPLFWHERGETGTIRYRYLPWPDGNDPPYCLQDRERLSEDLRLAYVALTRAQVHCELWIGNAGRSAGKTALHWLLSDRRHDFASGPFEHQEIEQALDELNEHPHIQVRAIEDSPAPPDRGVSMQSGEEPELKAAELKRSIRNDWKVASFSALTQEVHQASRVAPGSGADFALSYPAGPQVGLFLHSLLEWLDPELPLRPQLAELVPRLAIRHGLPAEQDLEGLDQWLGWILDTPLDGESLCLRRLEHSQVLHELPFDFGTGQVDPAALDSLLRQHPPAGIDPEHLPPIDFPQFQGMVTGIIDLVFEYQGSYYLADYKSNLLGRRLDDYQVHCLAEEIAARRYDLQYLLYSLALHRHLRSRLVDYDYEEHFGGVYYLFLRGMRPDATSPTGVWFQRPAPDLIERLDNEIFAPEPDGVSP